MMSQHLSLRSDRMNIDQLHVELLPLEKRVPIDEE